MSHKTVRSWTYVREPLRAVGPTVSLQLYFVLTLLAVSCLACAEHGERDTKQVTQEPVPTIRDEPPAKPPEAPKVRSTPPPDLRTAEMLPLAPDRLLFWTPSWALVRHADGSFGHDLPLPEHTVFVAPANQGFVAVTDERTPDQSHSQVVLFDHDGKETGRFGLPARVLTVQQSSGFSLVLTDGGAIKLGPHGKVDAPIPYPADVPQPVRGAATPYLFEHDGKSVFCLGNMATKSYDVAPHCQSPPDESYAFRAHFHRALSCGEWLVLLEGEMYDKLTVRSLATGKVLQSRTYPRAPAALLCAEPGQLVVATAGKLERLALPTLEAKAKVSLARGEEVRDVAVLADSVAYRLAERPNEVLFAARR